MKLTFLGTRGEIDFRTPRHYRHTATMVSYRGHNVMIDCGADWLGGWQRLSPRQVVLTHAHPDHAGGLAEGAACPVYATKETWEKLEPFPVRDRRTVTPRRSFSLRGLTFEAFTVEHSLNAPAVGYRIAAGRACIFYVPDLVYIHEREEALRGVRLYIGDGASVARSLVRRRGDRLLGHTSVRTQLTWCEKAGIAKMIVTHCGSDIVGRDERRVAARVRAFARERGVEAEIGTDGMEVVLR